MTGLIHDWLQYISCLNSYLLFRIKQPGLSRYKQSEATDDIHYIKKCTRAIQGVSAHSKQAPVRVLV